MYHKIEPMGDSEITSDERVSVLAESLSESANINSDELISPHTSTHVPQVTKIVVPLLVRAGFVELKELRVAIRPKALDQPAQDEYSTDGLED